MSEPPVPAGSPMSGQDAVVDHERWRAVLFDSIHRVIAWLCLLSYFLLGWAGLTQRRALLVVVPLAGVHLLYLVRHRVSFRVRAAVFTALTFTTAAYTLAVFGTVPGVPVMFLLAAVLTAIWVGPRIAISLIVASSLLTAIVAGMRAAGFWSLPPAALGDPNLAANVVRMASVNAILGVLIVAMVAYAITTADRYARERAEALDKLREEAEQRAAALAARQQAELALVQAQKLDLVGRMASGVSHDFNNALTVILTWADILERHPDDLRDGLDAIRQAALSSAQLTRRLLVLGRHAPRELRGVNLDAHIVELGRMLGRVLPENITLEVESEGVPTVLADSGELDQAVLNLALNARDAMPDGGALQIRAVRGAPRDAAAGAAAEPCDAAAPAGAWVGLRVTDSGTGMDDATQAHLFEPFFTTKGERGTGLGLTSVHAIVDALGGCVEVDSAPGRGTSITLWMPARPDAPVAGTDPTAIPLIRGARILLVEDDAALRRVMVAALRGAGHEVLEAANVDGALDIARRMRGDISLLCTDGVMPGAAVGHLVRSFRGLYPEAAVLLCSGYLSPDVPTLDELGASFLAKPFDTSTLLARIGELLVARAGTTRPGARA